jgi:Antirestriction protein
MPSPSTFHSQEDYYHSLYHEMTHAVGHSSRLDREGITQQAKFGSERYSKGGVDCGTRRGIPLQRSRHPGSRSVRELRCLSASWIAKLENDSRMIVSAASQAQRSTDFIWDRTEGEPSRISAFLGRNAAHLGAREWN